MVQLQAGDYSRPIQPVLEVRATTLAYFTSISHASQFGFETYNSSQRNYVSSSSSFHGSRSTTLLVKNLYTTILIAKNDFILFYQLLIIGELYNHFFTLFTETESGFISFRAGKSLRFLKKCLGFLGFLGFEMIMFTHGRTRLQDTRIRSTKTLNTQTNTYSCMHFYVERLYRPKSNEFIEIYKV